MRIKTRILSIALAAFLTFAVAGQAKAYFEDDHLIMFAYTLGGNEVGYDFGELATMDFSGSPVELAAAGTFDFLADTGATSLADVNVGIYVGSDHTYRAGFVTTLADTEPTLNSLYASAFWTSIDAIRGIYDGGSTQKVSMPYGDPGSYGQAMNLNTYSPGIYAGFNNSFEYGELNLADAGGLNDLYLYHYVATGPGVFALDSGDTTAHKGVLDIGLDGSVTLNAANPVPIPGAALLLGSGLLGLVGIRRRKLA